MGLDLWFGRLEAQNDGGNGAVIWRLILGLMDFEYTPRAHHGFMYLVHMMAYLGRYFIRLRGDYLGGVSAVTEAHCNIVALYIAL